ncbi:mucin-5AC isoform X2 [Magallana gigas]|uniref:mucin-5AC isoform X2 n=1 Tax=Magallana gigas TaxID=29159 RepID=UPI0033415426
MACVENVFGNIPKSGASLNGNKIYCPECTLHNCNFIHCETCVYHGFVHGTQLHDFKTCELKGECSQNLYICCHDYQCIDKLFRTNFQSTLSTIQSTTGASITSKTTDRASTTKAHALSHATTIQPTHHVSGAATSTYRTITTRQQSTAPPTTTSSTIGTNNNCVDELRNCAMFKSMGVCQANPQEGTKYEIAFQCKLTCDRCNETYKPLPTIALTTPTTIGTTRGTNNSCVDELGNCAMFKSMGVCHAMPQEGTKYDIAFQCKLTCNRCNETYKPLTTVTSTIPTTIGTTQELYQFSTTVASTIANPTSTDGHLPCPVCTNNICDHSNTISCEVCQITFNHQPQPQNAKCLNRGQCFEDDSNLCCTDLACAEIILKHLDAVTNYPLIQPEIHASIKRKTPEESNTGDLLRENGEKKN